MPNELYYRVLNAEDQVFLAAARCQLPLLLKGPTGCGKSRFVSFMAEKLEQKLYTVVCNEETSATDLLGRYLLNKEGTEWLDGPVTQAVKEGGILYLDEVVEAREDIISIIHSLSDFRRMLYLDKKSENILAHENFLLVMSYNPGYQSGLKNLKPSTRQRFVSIEFNYPEESVERDIVIAESSLDAKRAKKLVHLARQIRKMSELQLLETASTRLIVNAAQLMREGLTERAACEHGLISPLSDDIDDLNSLREFSALVF